MRQHPAHGETSVDPTFMADAERDKQATPAVAGGQATATAGQAGQKRQNRVPEGSVAQEAVEVQPAPESPLAAVLRTLEAQQEAVQVRLTELDVERARLAGEVERITAAIAALKGTPPPRGGGVRLKAKPAASGYTTAEVVDLVGEALRAGPLPEAELKAKLNEQAQANGRNRAGLHLRVKHALKDSRFTHAGGKWKLV